MSDRSYCTVTIFQAPVETHAAILTLLEESVLSPLDLGTEYTFEEVSLGTGWETADALLALSRDIAFRIQQDPYYGTDGDLYMHHPALGLYSVECTAQGQPVIGYDAVQAAVDKAMGDDDGAARVRVLAALRTLFGLNYTSLFWGTA